jgi:hypothetical protein
MPKKTRTALPCGLMTTVGFVLLADAIAGLTRAPLARHSF